MHRGRGEHVDVASRRLGLDKNVADLVEIGGRAYLGAKLIDAVGRNAVGSAVDEEGIGARRIFGDVDGGKEARAVAHGNAIFVVGVVLFDVEVGASGLGGLGPARWRCLAVRSRAESRVCGSTSSAIPQSNRGPRRDCRARRRRIRQTGELLSREMLPQSLRPGEVCGTHKPRCGAAKGASSPNG